MSDLVLRPAAVADLKKAYDWYEKERPGLGEEFLFSVHRAIDRVRSTPLAYAIVHRDTRRVLVRRFPYGLFFRIIAEKIVLVACYHLHRRPASWKRRR